jgi:hypothetical protein
MINARATIVASGGLGFAAVLCVIGGILVVSFVNRVVHNPAIASTIPERSVSWGGGEII